MNAPLHAQDAHRPAPIDLDRSAEADGRIDAGAVPLVHAAPSDRAEAAVADDLGRRANALVSSDPYAFRAAAALAFGDKADPGSLGTLVETAHGDRLPVPPVRFVDAGALGPDALGAYGDGAIFLDRRLLGDPARLERVYLEELGHHLDAVLGGADAAGDEGAIFARALLAPEAVPSGTLLASLRVENDHARLLIDGREIAVEHARQDGPGTDGISGGGGGGGGGVGGDTTEDNNDGDGTTTTGTTGGRRDGPGTDGIGGGDDADDADDDVGGDTTEDNNDGGTTRGRQDGPGTDGISGRDDEDDEIAPGEPNEPAPLGPVYDPPPDDGDGNPFDEIEGLVPPPGANVSVPYAPGYGGGGTVVPPPPAQGGPVDPPRSAGASLWDGFEDLLQVLRNSPAGLALTTATYSSDLGGPLETSPIVGTDGATFVSHGADLDGEVHVGGAGTGVRVDPVRDAAGRPTGTYTVADEAEAEALQAQGVPVGPGESITVAGPAPNAGPDASTVDGSDGGGRPVVPPAVPESFDDPYTPLTLPSMGWEEARPWGRREGTDDCRPRRLRRTRHRRRTRPGSIRVGTTSRASSGTARRQ